MEGFVCGCIGGLEGYTRPFATGDLLPSCARCATVAVRPCGTLHGGAWDRDKPSCPAVSSNNMADNRHVYFTVCSASAKASIPPELHLKY